VEERNEEGERGSRLPIEGGGRGEAAGGVEALPAAVEVRP
jgi:hypothetical protein